VLIHYGFEFLVESPAFAPINSLRKKSHEHSPPERVRMVLEELGPTYIKLGQAASTRPDIVPPEYAHELTKLQDRAPAVPFPDIAHVIKEELGFTPETVFGCFNREPRGIASIAQVHEAVLPDGEEVVIKVQRPKIRERIDADLPVLHDVVDYLSDHSAAGSSIDLQGWFSEFEFSLLNELDFTREARNAERFRRNFGDDKSIYIPKVYWQYTTPRVLTLELVEGTKISDVDQLDRDRVDRKELARTAALLVLKMVYDHGFFHADPHAGNFFVLGDGRIALIDFGMVGRLDDELKDALMRIALAVSRRDADQLTDEVLSFAYSEGRVDREGLKRDINRLIITHMEGGVEKFSMANMLNETLTAAAQHGLIVPSSIALLARTFTMAEGMGAMLDPDFNLTAFSEPYLEELFAKRYSREAMLERARVEGPFLADLVMRFPKRAERILSRVERGEFAVISRIDDIDEIVRHMHLATNRLSVSFITASLIVSLAIFMVAFGARGLAGTIITALFIVVGGAGMLLLISIWRSGKGPRNPERAK